MVFLPRSEILSLEEIAELARHFVARGVSRIRLTGGEPLGRRGAIGLVREIGQLVGHGLDELTLTTNGSRLSECADDLFDAGVRRINVSLDTRDEDKFAWVTRKGRLAPVLDGLEAAKQAGLAVKINMVALNGINDGELVDMLGWCGSQGFDLSLIETMPLGEIDEDRTDRFFPLTEAMERIKQSYELVPSTHRTGGPARYWQVPALGVRLGLISPLTNNFCASCNRVRVSASGQLFMCLGAEDHVDLKAALRHGGEGALDALLDTAMGSKPERHHFALETAATHRHMNVTGG